MLSQTKSDFSPFFGPLSDHFRIWSEFWPKSDFSDLSMSLHLFTKKIWISSWLPTYSHSAIFVMPLVFILNITTDNQQYVYLKKYKMLNWQKCECHKWEYWTDKNENVTNAKKFAFLTFAFLPIHRFGTFSKRHQEIIISNISKLRAKNCQQPSN